MGTRITKLTLLEYLIDDGGWVEIATLRPLFKNDLSYRQHELEGLGFVEEAVTGTPRRGRPRSSLRATEAGREAGLQRFKNKRQAEIAKLEARLAILRMTDEGNGHGS